MVERCLSRATNEQPSLLSVFSTGSSLFCPLSFLREGHSSLYKSYKEQSGGPHTSDPICNLLSVRCVYFLSRSFLPFCHGDKLRGCSPPRRGDARPLATHLNARPALLSHAGHCTDHGRYHGDTLPARFIPPAANLAMPRFSLYRSRPFFPWMPTRRYYFSRALLATLAPGGKGRGWI